MNSMTLTRLTELLDTYGADAKRWPEADRGDALKLLATSEHARALRDSAALLDASLDLYAVAPVDAQLRGRILASFPPAPVGWRAFLTELWQDLGGFRLVAPAFAASLALGAILPIWLDQSATDLPDEDLIATMLLADSDTEMPL